MTTSHFDEFEREGIPIPNSDTFPAEGSGDRNKAEQEEALRKYLSPSHKLFEIASGFGEAISYIANSHPDVICVPSDPQKPCLERLRELSHLYDNMTEPIELNIFVDSQWDQVAKKGPFDVVLAFNLIHLIPWRGTRSILERASQLLEQSKGILVFHGAFLREGTFLSLSDREFDEDIRSRNPQWGLRDLEEVIRIATEHGFRREEIREMRAGNWMVILRRH